MTGLGLGREYITLIDDSVYEKYGDCGWWATGRTDGYISAECTIDKRKIRLSRLVMGVVDDLTFDVDHIDGNSLNNQRSNLRLVTKSQNQMNRKKAEGTTSQYKGVSWNKKLGIWLVVITYKRKQVKFGFYRDEHEAGHVYNEAAKAFFGEYAKLNDIKGELPLTTSRHTTALEKMEYTATVHVNGHCTTVTNKNLSVVYREVNKWVNIPIERCTMDYHLKKWGKWEMDNVEIIAKSAPKPTHYTDIIKDALA